MTGEAIAKNIFTKLSLWQLPVSLLCGQSYDRAGAMSRQISLCIVKCCKIRTVSNMIDTVNSVAHFFNNSPKRQLVLEKWIADVQPCVEK